MATVERMRPSDLRYTHGSISYVFSDSIPLVKTFREILFGNITIRNLPYLVAMRYDSDWFVVRGNRRLYVYKALERVGKISKVNIKCVPFDLKLFTRQYSSDNDGIYVRIRGNPGLAEDFEKKVRSWKYWSNVGLDLQLNSSVRRESRQQTYRYKFTPERESGRVSDFECFNDVVLETPRYREETISSSTESSVCATCCKTILMAFLLLFLIVLFLLWFVGDLKEILDSEK